MNPWPIESLGTLSAPDKGSITDGPFGSNLTSAHYTDAGPLVVRLQNIGDGVFRRAPAHISAEHFATLRKHEVQAGDLLVASLGETLPRACLAPEDLGPAIVKADCIRIRLRDDVDKRWVMYALQRPAARKWATEGLHGVGRLRLGLKIIREIPVPLPPLHEQRRIIDILEDHLSRLDAADRLVEHGAARLASLVASALRSSPELDDASTLPLRDLLREPLANGRSVPTRAGGFPVLRLTALQGNRVQLSERKSGAWTEVDAEPFLVVRDDIFVSRGNGSLSLVGRASRVVDEPDPVAFPDTMVRLRVDGSLIDAAYLVEVWNSRLVRNQIERAARTTAGIYKVNQGQLGGVELPIPPREAQSKVVARLSAVREAAETIADRVRITHARSRSLRSALLAAAFSGRLTGRASDMDLAKELVS